MSNGSSFADRLIRSANALERSAVAALLNAQDRPAMARDQVQAVANQAAELRRDIALALMLARTPEAQP